MPVFNNEHNGNTYWTPVKTFRHYRNIPVNRHGENEIETEESAIDQKKNNKKFIVSDKTHKTEIQWKINYLAKWFRWKREF